jgi:hypothetical protein
VKSIPFSQDLQRLISNVPDLRPINVQMKNSFTTVQDAGKTCITHQTDKKLMVKSLVGDIRIRRLYHLVTKATSGSIGSRERLESDEKLNYCDIDGKPVLGVCLLISNLRQLPMLERTIGCLLSDT